MYKELKDMLINYSEETKARKKEQIKSLNDCIIAVEAINRMMERREKQTA